ncbi:MAG: UDP-N-acetylmuramate--L-alanine ligase [Candidatus Neomarinimicrobiota bacterium]
MMFGRIKKVHFVGIGGIGMSGIAELLLNLGFKVTGSDLESSEITRRLQAKGAEIMEGHDYANVDDCDLSVYSSAIERNNVELEAARNKNIPVISRSEMLAEILKLKPTSVAVGGTHGKTTTTSMIGAVLTEANLDPTLVVGGVVRSLDVNAVLGSGDTIVAEADEFDRSFLRLHPTYSVITTIDMDHMECYEDQEDLLRAFAQFANAIPFYGSVVICIDETFCRQILPNISRPSITYGFSDRADLQAQEIEFHEIYSDFKVKRQGRTLGNIHLRLPGGHNVKNALAAVALGTEMNIDFSTIKQALEKFNGVRRRFEVKGIYDGIMVVDDYAHHPTEVTATLSSVKSGWDRRIISVFQPHLYTRTRDFYEDFARSLMMSDVAIVTDIYPAREELIQGVSGEMIVDSAKAMGHREISWIKEKADVVRTLADIAKAGDLVITLGAGDIWQVCDEFVKLLQKQKVSA